MCHHQFSACWNFKRRDELFEGSAKGKTGGGGQGRKKKKEMEHSKEDNGKEEEWVFEKMTLLFIRLFVASWDWKMQNFKHTVSRGWDTTVQTK